MDDTLTALLAELNALLHPQVVAPIEEHLQPYVFYFTFFTDREKSLWWDTHCGTEIDAWFRKNSKRTWHLYGDDPSRWAREIRGLHPDWFVLPVVVVDHVAAALKMAEVLQQIALELAEVRNAIAPR